jgi:glyoxalase/bleomycin resistance protein/dioxygenase superfamily protein
MFEQLDFLYTPTDDVPGELRFYEDVVGARVVFAISDMNTKVAAVELTSGPPLVLLTDHLEGDRPILVFRVADLDATLADLDANAWKPERTLEIPHGPCCSFRTPGGHRFALYQLIRPEVAAHFEGRRDF